jgi:hypothetical protein
VAAFVQGMIASWHGAGRHQRDERSEENDDEMHLGKASWTFKGMEVGQGISD